MRLNDVLTIIALSLISQTINIPLAYAALSSECPGRDVTTIRRLADQTELSFILYYVSWCHESRQAKEVYDEVSQFYYDQASFAAINCWHMECNCSYTFQSALGSKKGYPYKWPTLLVRYGYGRVTVQYYDEWKFEALARLIANLYQPVERLNAKIELKKLTLRSNAVVLGLFPNAYSKDYQKFTLAAVKWLESDPERLIRFAVGFGAVAEDLLGSLAAAAPSKTATMPFICLLTDKEIQYFNTTGKYAALHIVNWLKGEVKRLRKHFYGFSTPMLLSEHLRRGPALTIFVNERENSSSSSNNNHSFYPHMINVMKKFGYTMPAERNAQQCQEFWPVAVSEDQNAAMRLYAIRLKQESIDNSTTIGARVCKARPLLNTAYAPFEQLRQQYRKAFLMQYQTSVKQLNDDLYATTNLLQLFKYNECLRSSASETTPAELKVIIAKLLAKFIKKIAMNANGVGSNRTLSVHILDANKYQGLMRDLGLQNYEQPSPVSALIIEPSQEGIYVMKKPQTFHYEILLNFIKNYYNNSLHIMRKSSSLSSPMMSKTGTRIHELNRQMFLNGIQHHWHNMTTILLLYSPRCAISWLMSHALLQVEAALLQPNHQQHHHHHSIQIVRINTQTNDLPWEYVMPTVPALIVFPRGRPAESRLFPSSLKIDVRNIFGFILAQLEPLEQVQLSLASCDVPQSMPTPQPHLFKCLQFVKTLAMQHISEHLLLWQRYPNDRQDILKRLKIFKDITLNIQASFPL